MISRPATLPRLRWKAIAEPGEQFHVARPCHTRRSAFRLHTHDFTELFWVDAGEGWHLLNGERHPCHAGQVWFIHPHDAHGFEVPASNTLAITNVAFPTETAEYLRARYFSAATWWWRPQQARPLTLTPARLHALNTAANRLALAPRDRLPIEFFLLSAFAELSADATHHAVAGAPDWLAAACRGLQEPRHFRAGLPAFFRLASKCPEHVARVMRKTLKTTPSDYLNRVRLTHAAFQLRMTSRPVTEIALDAGYGNLSYFYIVFRQQYGCSPRRYRTRLDPR